MRWMVPVMLTVATTLFLNSTTGAHAQKPPDLVPIFNLTNGYDRIMVNNCAARREGTFSRGFGDLGVLGYWATKPGPGLVRLYQFVGGSQHVYRQDNGPLNVGFKKETPELYVSAAQQPGTIPLWEVWFNGSDRHREFVTSPLPTDQVGGPGRSVTLLGYVWDDKTDPCPTPLPVWEGVCSCNVSTSDFSCHGRFTLQARSLGALRELCASRTAGRGGLESSKHVQ